MKKILTILCFSFVALTNISIQAQVSKIQPVNGTVRASVLNTTTGILYIGGDFTAVNTYITGFGAIISTTTGLPELAWPTFDGQVRASISDGS
jgi:hypothetical protein